MPPGSPHTVAFSKTRSRCRPNGNAEVESTLNVPVATAGASRPAFREVAGLVQFTPATASDNAGVTLRVPYYLVPRAQSPTSRHRSARQARGHQPVGDREITNKHGAIAGDADFYAWGLEDKKDKGKVSNDVRAVGVQSFPFPSAAIRTRQLIVFAVNTYDRWSNASTNEFDIFVDVDGDGIDDYIVVGADQGAVRPARSTAYGSFVFSTRSGGASIVFLATRADRQFDRAAAGLSTQLCRAAEPCLSAANPRITYQRGELRPPERRRRRGVTGIGEVQRLDQRHQHRAVSRPSRRAPRTRAT